MSGVRFQVSGVICQVSGARCQVSGVIFFYFINFFFGQSGGASRWRVCYQRGLPRLVFEDIGKTVKFQYFHYLFLSIIGEHNISIF